MTLKEDIGCFAISILVVVAGLFTAAAILIVFNYVYGGALWNWH